MRSVADVDDVEWRSILTATPMPIVSPTGIGPEVFEPERVVYSIWRREIQPF